MIDRVVPGDMLFLNDGSTIFIDDILVYRHEGSFHCILEFTWISNGKTNKYRGPIELAFQKIDVIGAELIRGAVKPEFNLEMLGLKVFASS